MRPLRILFVSEFPLNGVVRGGVESAVQTLATALSRSDDVEAVLVLNFRPERDCDEIVKVNHKLSVHVAAGQRRFALPTRSFLDLKRAKEVAGQFNPDVVHGQGTDTHGDVATRLGYPSVITIHGVGSFEVELREKSNPVLGPLRIGLTKKMIKRVIVHADAVISLSEFDRNSLSSIRKNHFVRIPNAVRPEYFQTEPAFPDTHHILFTGLIIERKNIVGLVKAFAMVKRRIPDAVLDIAGPVAGRKYFEEVVNNIDPSTKKDIVFHGDVRGDALVKLVTDSSVAVLFSNHENLPVAVAEALALGKPVVASRVGAVGEMINDGFNGFLVEPRDEEMFAEKMVQLLEHRELRRQMGLNGYKLAHVHWTPEAVVAQTLRAYRQLLGEEDIHRRPEPESAEVVLG